MANTPTEAELNLAIQENQLWEIAREAGFEAIKAQATPPVISGHDMITKILD